MATKLLTYDRGAVKRLRAAKGLTILEVAFKAKLSQGAVYNIEDGTEPKAGTLARLALALDVPVSAFFTKNGKAA